MRDLWRILKKRTVWLNLLRLLAVFLVIILCIILFVYSNAKRILEEELVSSSRNAAMTQATQLDDHISTLSKAVATLCANNLVEFYVELPASSTLLFDGIHTAIRSQIQTLVNSYESVYSVQIISMQDDSCITNTGYFPLDQVVDTAWLEHLPASADDASVSILPLRKYDDTYPFVMTFVKSVGASDRKGYVALNMNIKKMPTLMGIKDTEDAIYIVSDDGQVLYRSLMRGLGETVRDVAELSSFGQQTGNASYLVADGLNPYVYTQIHSDKGDWYYISINRLDQYLDRLTAQRMVLAAFSVVIMLVFLLVGVIFVFNAYKPIQKILNIMDDPHNWITTEGYTSAEVKQITEQVVRYVQTNTTLSNELQTQLNVLKDVRLWAMQTQLNPHFIFNTLNLIHVECVHQLGYKNSISATILSFSKLIRYALYSETSVSFATELEHARIYLELLKERYGDSFSYEISVDNACMPATVPKLLLQPILENTTEHGADFDHKGRLTVRLTASVTRHQDTEYMQISIADDGIGMDEAQLSHLRNHLATSADHTDAHIGLRNVANRLRLLYADETQVSVDSVSGEGTCVTLRLPTSVTG